MGGLVSCSLALPLACVIFKPTMADSIADLKQAGNAHFREGQFPEAIAVYTQCIKMLQAAGEGSAGTPGAPESRAELATLLTNRAYARYQTRALQECIADCDAALELEPGRVKALFKRAQVWCCHANRCVAITWSLLRRLSSRKGISPVLSKT